VRNLYTFYLHKSPPLETPRGKSINTLYISMSPQLVKVYMLKTKAFCCNSRWVLLQTCIMISITDYL